MRPPAIPLTVLTLALVGCADALPTAVPAGDRAAGARASADAVALPFRGTLDAASHTVDPATYTLHLVGTGTATHLGRFTLESALAFVPGTLTAAERMTLTAANGDRLFATGTAQGFPSADGTNLSSVEVLTITGGTGRFARATGSFTLRQVNLAPDRYSSGAFEGTIRLRRTASD